MYTRDNFELFAAIAGLIAVIPVYKGWFIGVLSWNRQRQIEKLRKEKAFLTFLHSSDREFIGWLLHKVLLVVTIFSVALMFRSIEVDPGGPKLVVLFHWVLGGGAYVISIFALGVYHRLRNYGNSIAKIDEKIKKMSGDIATANHEKTPDTRL